MLRLLQSCCLSSLCILVGACAEEPDFDTRYEQAEQEISAKADAIDAELAGQVEETGGDAER